MTDKTVRVQLRGDHYHLICEIELPAVFPLPEVVVYEGAAYVAFADAEGRDLAVYRSARGTYHVPGTPTPGAAKDPA